MSVASFFERRIVWTSLLVTTCYTVNPAFAAGSNMPWEQPLNQILQSVEGPVAKIIAVLIIITTGLSLAFIAFVGVAPCQCTNHVSSEVRYTFIAALSDRCHAFRAIERQKRLA